MDYHGSHRPFSDGDPLHALSSCGTFPPDVYQHPEWYTFGEYGLKSAAVALLVRNQPARQIPIYRALPPDCPHVINPGDWICLVKEYARQHAIRTDDPADDWPVIASIATVRDIRSGGSDLVEWGYFGSEPLKAVLRS